MQKKIVLPGEKVADQKVQMANTYWDGNATYAAAIGTIDDEGKYLSLESRYKPQIGDLMVGVIIDARSAGYEVGINLPTTAFVPFRTTRLRFEIGDMVSGKVAEVNEVGDVDLLDVQKFPKGKLVSFPTSKVPRLIGKKSSMLSVIKNYTNGDMVVGNNGYVWLSEQSNIPLALKAIDLVIEKAHTSGLTDEMETFLKAQKAHGTEHRI